MRNGCSELSYGCGRYKSRLLVGGKRLEMGVMRIAAVIFSVAGTALVVIFMICIHGMMP